MKAIWLAAAVVLVAPSAAAEVTDTAPHGFAVTQAATIAAPPARVWRTLLQPRLWWDGGHTYSGDAANLSIDLEAGCFCERLPNGQVRHMTVVYAEEARTLRLFGGLGPLQQSGAAGALTVSLTPERAGTKVTLSYDVGGYARGGLERWAAPVDGVLGAQLQGLKQAAETGAGG